MLKIFILINLFLIFSVRATVNVACTHPEVCLLLLPNSSINFTSIELKNGDPHEFEPSSKDIKDLINADYLIVGPIELNPWIKNVIKQRNSLKPNTTINLEIKNESIHYYNNGSTEALSHFWLYPKIYCDLKEQINKNSILKKLEVKSDEKCESQKIETLIKEILKSNQNTIVFSHDALAPFVKTYAPHINFISLKGSGHHEEISPASIKALYNLQKRGPTLWIVEKNINIPNNIMAKISSKDKVIKIDTSHSKEENVNAPKEFEKLTTIYKFIKSL